MSVDPLQGLFVLDLSRVLAGPMCTMRLADLGARVVKIEAPDGDPTRRFGPPFVGGESPYFMAFNRGKESVRLDLASAPGQEILRRLLGRADVLVDNFRPGVLARLGLGETELSEVSDRLVHVTISGFGGSGERSRAPAFDLAVQAESGLMRMTGPAGAEPCRVPISIADVAGAMCAVEAVCAALLRRERGGGGARIRISLLDALLSFFGFQAQATIMTGRDPEPMGHRHPNLVPYQAFATADGWLVLAVATDRQWQALLAVDGIPPLLMRPEWRTNAGRVDGRDRLVPELESAFRLEATAAWCKRLAAADVPYGRVRTLSEALSELEERGDGGISRHRHESLGGIAMVGSPAVLDGRRPVAAAPPPTLGGHTDAVLREIAGDEDEYRRWRGELDET